MQSEKSKGKNQKSKIECLAETFYLDGHGIELSGSTLFLIFAFCLLIFDSALESTPLPPRPIIEIVPKAKDLEVRLQRTVLCASNTPHPSTIGKIRLKLNEGLTGWVARERKLLAISREAYKDSRFKTFGELPEDTFEAFLSAPVIARNRVVGVINVQHRFPHQHTGNEMEVLTTVGEQVGCVLVLARMAPNAVAEANHVELVLSSGPTRPRG